MPKGLVPLSHDGKRRGLVMSAVKNMLIIFLAVFGGASGCILAPLAILGGAGAVLYGASLSYQGGEIVLGEFENTQPTSAEKRDRIKSLNRVAVAQFTGEAGSASTAVIAALQPYSQIKVIGPTDFRRKQEELGEGTRTPASGPRQVELAQLVGQALNAEGVIIGSVEELGVDRPGVKVEYRHKITARLVACSTGEILWWEGASYTIKVGTRVPTEEEAMQLVVPKLMDRFAAVLKT